MASSNGHQLDHTDTDDPEITSTLPRDPTVSAYSISWSNLSYNLSDYEDYDRDILVDLNGIAYPGFIVGVLGNSGTERTAVLDVLAGRVNPSHVTGLIQINGATNVQINQVSRYCPKGEALFGNLTVFETLMYAADLRLPSITPRGEKMLVVKNLLLDFGLSKVKDTIIGSKLRNGCSGGEVRRVSVASQVIGLKTGILFLDEPTAGLDSADADAVMSSIRNLAKKYNIACIATMHQPSTATFELFTHFLLLAHGRSIYYGDREEAIPYFEFIGYPIPNHANPADIYLQLVSPDFDTKPTESQEQIRKLVEAFHRSEENKYLLAEILENHNFPPVSDGAPVLPTKNPFLAHTTVLLSRGFVNTLKNPASYWIRLVMYIVLAILMGTTWWQMDTVQSTVNDRLACLFFATAFLSFITVAGIPAFLEDRKVFMHERAHSLYGSLSYVLSHTIVSIPFIFIIGLVFSAISYFCMGLQGTTENFCTYATLLFFALMIAEAQMVLISVAIPAFVSAFAVCAFTNGLWMVFAGYFVQKKNLPDFWHYSIHPIDFQKYVYELLISNEFSGLKFTCNDSQPNACACIIPPKNVSSTCGFTGEDVLSFYDYANVDYTAGLLILGCIFLVLKILTWILLKFLTRNKIRAQQRNAFQSNIQPYTFQNPQISKNLKNVQIQQTGGIERENKTINYDNPDGDEKLV